MQTKEKALFCASQVLDKKATQVRVLDVRSLSSLTEFLILASGSSDRQVQACAEAVHQGLKKYYDLLPLGIEGMQEGRWVLLDYGDVMVHVFHEPVRQFYDLDGLWGDAREVPLPDEEQSAALAQP